MLCAFLLVGCVGAGAPAPDHVLESITGRYEIAFWQKDTDTTSPVRVYIEGDGHSFDGHGRPTNDPTPRGTFMRDLAARDASPNVVYMARPCQFTMSKNCTVHDWTDGRFSDEIIDEMAGAVRFVARNRPVVLIGYSFVAFVTAAIIEKNPDLNVGAWITIAGVLNHTDWTEYFGDVPLTGSVSLNELPRTPARHYVAAHDNVVPRELSVRWVGAENLIVIPNSTHTKFPNFNIDNK